MPTKEIFGFLSVIPDRSKQQPGDPVLTDVQTGNVFFKHVTRRRTIYYWDNNNSGATNHQVMAMLPWKQGGLVVDDDDNVGHSMFGDVNSTLAYPRLPPSGNISLWDYKKFRMSGTSTSIISTDEPFVFGAVVAWDQSPANPGIHWLRYDSIISVNDIPTEYTQIGNVYAHPMVWSSTADLTTAVGLSYVTFANAHYLDDPRTGSHSHNLVRIQSGADAGLYLVRYVDYLNNRLYLQNLDGTLFSGQANASVMWAAGPGRRHYFNEVSVIQFSAGSVVTGGTFRPGAVRNSFIMRVIFDKTGDDATAAGAEQQGSYFITMRPYTRGVGNYLATGGRDTDQPSDDFNICHGGVRPQGLTNFAGGINGIALDESTQRVWAVGIGESGGYINHWRWKTCENMREIANATGTGTHKDYVTPALNVGAGDVPVDCKYGSYSGWTYILIRHATAGNAGVAIIKPNLTTLQYTTAGTFPSPLPLGSGLDLSRARLGSPGDVTTTVATDQVNSASGAFTNADIGRVIVLTGGTNNNGSYKIDTVPSATQVTVVTLAGAAVSFGSGGTGGRFEIGERLYLFFTDTTGVGKINYMESLAPGTFLTRTVAMTNGSVLTGHLRNGQSPAVAVDPANGNVYWTSSDVQYQINKYDVLTNSHSFMTIANVQSPAGGTGTIGTITLFTSVLVNSKFDEIWVGSDQGQIKIIKSTFATGTVKRYYGSDDGNYANPAGFFRPDGNRTTAGVNHTVMGFWELPDGRVLSTLSNTDNCVFATYSREADLWQHRDYFSMYDAGATTYAANMVFDSIGNFFYLFPAAWDNANAQPMVGFGNLEVSYQWDNAGSKWIPLEVYQGALPNKSPSDTISPGCKAKPIHAGLEDVLYGVKLGFTRQVGPASNSQFLGRQAQTNLTLTDGATNGTTTFTGSGFTAGDVGKLLRIENSTVPADIGVYKVSAFLTASTLTLTKLNGGTFAPGTASGIQYTLWTNGTPSSTAGAETVTVMLADGFGKDNTQDISGITYENFGFKTVLDEDVEPTKFAVPNPLGVPGGQQMKVYADVFPRVGTAVLASHDLQTTHTRALPGAEWSNGGFDGSKLVDGFVDAHMNNAGSHGRMDTNLANVNIWYGVNPVSGALGFCPMVDLGADAEVGYVIMRGRCETTQSNLYTVTNHGMKATLYKANGPTAPVASATSRVSGVTNLNLTVNVTTISLASGDFLGAITTGPFANGSVVATQNTFNAPAATFVPADVGKILKITSVGDVGSYRIIAVDGTGAIATVQNLDQTAKTWLVTVSSIVYEVRNGVREEDVICVPSIGAPTQRLCIERLLTATTAQVRVAPHTTVAGVSYETAIPTWEKVKRVSFSTEAVPPEVKNNKTFICEDGREQWDLQDWKIFMDFSDLSPAQRTGRWFQMQMMPRFAGNVSSGDFTYGSFEFYSPTGARLGISPYTFTDHSLNNVDFFTSHINRLDFIQGRYDAMTGTAGVNGTVDLGGANGDTLTLTTGGNKFLGYQIDIHGDGVCVAGLGGNFTSATAAFSTADVGRILWLQTGVNAGYYRIATAAPTALTLTLPSGAAAPSFTGTSGETFSIHEGISVSLTAPDRIVFLDDLTREYTLASISDNLQTLTIAEARQTPVTAKQWEIRRPAFDTSSATVDSSKLARLPRPATTYPLQTGDVCHDSRGALKFWADDIGSGNERSDGSIAGGSGVFVGSRFCKDDEGRLLRISTGVTANRGWYRILTYTNATTVTLVNAYTGAAVVFTADAAADKVYRVYGDRRFKITKQVTTLRA